MPDNSETVGRLHFLQRFSSLYHNREIAAWLAPRRATFLAHFGAPNGITKNIQKQALLLLVPQGFNKRGRWGSVSYPLESRITETYSPDIEAEGLEMIPQRQMACTIGRS